MTLQLNLQTPAKPFVTGGPMPIGLDLRNTGDAPVDVPASTEPSEFEYLLLSEDGSKTIQSLSYESKMISKGEVQRMQGETQPLAPGKFMIYADDLGALAVRPIAPGKYQLQALYRMPGNILVRSNRVPIQVIASRAAATVEGLDFRRAYLNAYEFQREGDGRFTLRKWTSSTDNLAQGQFQPLPMAAPANIPASVAMAIEVEHGDLGVWRWLAWTSGSQVQAEVTRAIDVKYPTSALATGLAEAELFESGYQFADGHGLFLLTGRGQSGRRIRLLRLSADDEAAPKFLDVALPAMPDSPARATFYSRPADPQDEAGKSAHQLALCWVLRSGAAYGFVMARIDPETGGVIEPPRTVFSSNRSVVAYAIPAVVRKELADSFALLLAPAREGDPYTRLTLDVHDTTRREEWDLPRFEGPAPVERWILPSTDTGNAPVLAVSGHRLWLARRGGAWQDTRQDVAGATSPIRLWTLPNGQFWCTWFDREQGYRVCRVA